MDIGEPESRRASNFIPQIPTDIVHARQDEVVGRAVPTTWSRFPVFWIDVTDRCLLDDHILHS